MSIETTNDGRGQGAATRSRRPAGARDQRKDNMNTGTKHRIVSAWHRLTGRTQMEAGTLLVDPERFFTHSVNSAGKARALQGQQTTGRSQTPVAWRLRHIQL